MNTTKLSTGLSMGVVAIAAQVSFTIAAFTVPNIATAQSCNYYAGKAAGGQAINVDLCSTSRVSDRSINFVYYLGREKVTSQANCRARTWTTFPEKTVFRPQSGATQNMLNRVCSEQVFGRSDQAVVFNPPSNVRVSPNGKVLCSVNNQTSITILGSTGSWYYTNACGSMGVIHSSQVRF